MYEVNQPEAPTNATVLDVGMNVNAATVTPQKSTTLKHLGVRTAKEQPIRVLCCTRPGYYGICPALALRMFSSSKSPPSEANRTVVNTEDIIDSSSTMSLTCN
ncbi:hypothetical protein AHAS_Ahas18G0119900 [Arachis hypogaea]